MNIFAGYAVQFLTRVGSFFSAFTRTCLRFSPPNSLSLCNILPLIHSRFGTRVCDDGQNEYYDPCLTVGLPTMVIICCARCDLIASAGVAVLVEGQSLL